MRRRLREVPWICAAAGALIAPEARANVISLTYNGTPLFTIADNDPQDQDPAVNTVRFSFTVTSASAEWTAQGTLTGVYVPLTSATTTMSAFHVEKMVMLPIMNNDISWTHSFEPNATALESVSATLTGQYDSSAGAHFIGGADLLYTTSADGAGQNFGLPSIDPPFAAGPGPVPFAGASGPILVPAVDTHRASAFFYLDTVGDFIEMTNSATIHSEIPAPGSLVALGATVAFGPRRRRAGPRRSVA